MTFAMYEDLFAACEQADADDEIRALVLRGAGAKAFVAGTDIRQFADFDASGEDGLEYEATIDRIVGRLEAVGKPTVALVDGYAMGSGLALSAACDLRICTPAARFGLPIARTVGNCLSMENYARLAGLLGPARLKDIVFTARTIEPDEALATGLATEVVEPDAIEARVEALCDLLASHAPVTLCATKEALRRIRAVTTPDGDDLDPRGLRLRAASAPMSRGSCRRDERAGRRFLGRRAHADRRAQPRAGAAGRAARQAGAHPAVAVRPAPPPRRRRRRGRLRDRGRSRPPENVLFIAAFAVPAALTIWLARRRGWFERVAWPLVTLAAEVALLFWVGFVALGYGPD